MPERAAYPRRWLRNRLLWLAPLLLFAGACQRRSPRAVAVPPPPPSYLALGDQSYEAGDYPAAIAAYSAYLRQNPGGENADRALFRLGLAHAIASSPAHDAAKAIAYFDQLTSQYPASPLRPEAELILGLNRQIQQLHSEVASREQQLAALREERDKMGQEVESLREQTSALEQLRGDLKGREDRIRQLSEELERLKAIDMQRRPATPPR